MIALTLNIQQISLALLGWLGSALLMGTILAGLTWLVIRLLRDHIRPSVEVVLWMLVLIKFVIPVGPGWSYSLPSLFDSLSLMTPVSEPFAFVGGSEPVPLMPASSPGVLESPVVTSRLGLTWPVLLASFYILSVMLMLAWRFYRHRRMAVFCRALPPADEKTRTLVRDVCRRLSVRRVPSIRISEDYPTPFIFGLVHPVLVFPLRLLVRPDELETVAVHEVTHLRRGDLYLRCLQWIVGTLLFFWPVVALVNRRIDMVREHACDQWALRHGKLSAKEYARSLLAAVTSKPFYQMAYRHICMAGRITTIERRIDMILKNPVHSVNRPIWKVVALAFLVGWGAFVLTGAVGTRVETPAGLNLAEKAVWEHAKQIVERIGIYPSADVNKDGEISFSERNAFLVALVKTDPQKALDGFLYSELFEDRELGLLEMYDLVRGLSYMESVQKEFKRDWSEAKKRRKSDTLLEELKIEQAFKEYESIQDILNGQDALLDNVRAKPKARVVAEIHRKIAQSLMKEEQIKQSRITEDIKKKIAELEAQGEEEKAMELRKKLKGLNRKADDAKLKAKQHNDVIAKLIEEVAHLKNEVAELTADGKREKSDQLKQKIEVLQAKIDYLKINKRD